MISDIVAIPRTELRVLRISHYISMKLLISQSEIRRMKSSDMVPLKCSVCGRSFHVEARFVRHTLTKRKDRNQHAYCSSECKYRNMTTAMEKECKNCSSRIMVQPNVYKRSKSRNFFCSRSCAATYNNTHKTTGTRRSKLEVWIEEQLSKDFPELNALFNSTKEIDSELDIYFPQLKLAVELNGIYHYEPIHGVEKLASIQNNDRRKFQACMERGIELLIIDTSALKYFKPANAQKYYNIIADILLEAIPRIELGTTPV
jgi:DNA-directed RNA polymerase subunit RPC12/RpoP